MCGDEMSNRRAVCNGKRAESLVLEAFDTELCNDPVDIWINDRPYEIKSCQEKIKKCSGRFWIEPLQHEFLLNNRGYYIFIVFGVKDQPKFSKIIRADRVTGPIDKPVTITWKRLFRGRD